MKLLTLVALGGLLALGACTSTGNIERNAAGGAALGGLAGAVIGNNIGDGDAKSGAAIGAVLGAGAGAVRGDIQDRKLGECRSVPRNVPLNRDKNGRQYYVVQGTNTTCWADGSVRS